MKKENTNESILEIAQMPTIDSMVKSVSDNADKVSLPQPKVQKAVYSYNELRKCGFKVAYFRVNRPINVAHANRLAKSATTCPNKTFLQSAKVVFAVDALRAGIDLFDEDGNKLTLSTEGIEWYLAIIDGQNREFAVRMNSSIDLNIEFMEAQGEDILKIIERLNTLFEKWSGNDFIHAVKQKYTGKVRLLDELIRLGCKYKVSRKYLLLLLCGEKDAVRRSKLIEALNKESPELSGYSVSDCAVGFAEKTLKAIQRRFKGYEKIVSNVMFAEALMNIKECLSVTDKKDYEDYLPAFVMRITDDKVAKIEEYIKSKKLSELKNYMVSSYYTFIQAHALATEMQEMKKAVDEELNSVMPDESGNEECVRKLKSGTVAELRQNEKELELQRQKIKEAKKKAQKEAREVKKQEEEYSKGKFQEQKLSVL